MFQRMSLPKQEFKKQMVLIKKNIPKKLCEEQIKLHGEVGESMTKKRKRRNNEGRIGVEEAKGMAQIEIFRVKEIIKAIYAYGSAFDQ